MLESAFNLVLMILGFGLLICFHELGHFLAARWAGIRTEAFAIGMGTPVVSWRKGVGFAAGSTHGKVVAATGSAPRDLSLEQLQRHGIGCTEYSLRWLPIGGFVKMLGQDDTDPGSVSDEPGSYNTCPIGRRMVVVSAGVVANIIIGVILFVVAFMAGVQSEKPVVGEVAPTMPAGEARAINAGALGISEPGLQPGDVITHIDGKPARTFVDVRIAAAMARPGQVLSFRVERPGVPEPLEFLIEPEKGAGGLLGIGIDPGRSTTLLEDDKHGRLAAFLSEQGLSECGLQPGMTMVSAAGRPVQTFGQFAGTVAAGAGRPVETTWRFEDRAEGSGRSVTCAIPVRPLYQSLRDATVPGAPAQPGLLGLTPLIEVASVDGPNEGLLAPGDALLRAGPIDGPRLGQLRALLEQRPGGEIDLVVLRDGREETLTARVDRAGMLGIGITWAWDVPLTAEPIGRVRTAADSAGAFETVETPLAETMLMGRTRIEAVNDEPVTDWATLREALRRSTRAAREAGAEAPVALAIAHPTPGSPRESMVIELSPEDAEALHELGWAPELPAGIFAPVYTTLGAGGNPLRAAAMGFVETHKMIVMTYLTIDRLIRGSVGVEQIRGPVGIVDVGTKMADRGFTYLLFFLGIISVNLAVINFLPIPIVDGGLFVFLVYEKLRGRPPSLAFQNAATIAGVALIATVLLVVTWNDLMRLVGWRRRRAMPTAIITGAGSGIGRATAGALASAGYALVLVGRRAGPLRETAARLAAESAICDADVTDPASADRPVEEALRRWGRVDALVNNAGSVETAPIGATSDALLGRMHAVHVVAPARLIARLWPVFAEQGSGCIVNVSSIATIDPFPGLSAYAAAKSAMESLTRSVVNEGRGLGVRAFSVAPGAVETAMLRDVVSKDDLPEAQALDPADVARVIAECVTGRRDEEIGRVIRIEK